MKNILFLVALIVSPVFAQAEEANNCGANDFALQILGSGGPFGIGRASAGCSGPDVRLFEADGTLIDNDIDKALEIYEKLVQEDYALSISVFTLRCPR